MDAIGRFPDLTSDNTDGKGLIVRTGAGGYALSTMGRNA
jgi:hypothetical protein